MAWGNRPKLEDKRDEQRFAVHLVVQLHRVCLRDAEKPLNMKQSVQTRNKAILPPHVPGDADEKPEDSVGSIEPVVLSPSVNMSSPVNVTNISTKSPGSDEGETDSTADSEEEEEADSEDEDRKAPIELLGEFLHAVMNENYTLANKLCQMILIYEADNPEAKQFIPLIEAKLLIGFLQRNNSLEDKSRIVSSFKERQAAKNLLSCENIDRDPRFRRTETDFSNLYARDLLPAKNGEEPTVQFLLEVVDILLSYIKKTFDRSTKVLDFHHPHQLLEGIEGFNLELSDQPESLEQILVDCRDSLKYGVRTGHPRFFNQLSSGLDIIGLAGEWLTSTANTNMFTYEIAPVFVLMEQLTLRKMREIIGWPRGDGDGIFSPGGAISNMYSVMAARYKYFPDVKTKGMAAVPKLILFTSELGYVPLYVNATAGTTVYGAFDPINEIADICEKYNLWLHVDGAWGGGLLMSRKHRHKLNGIERANSVTWNPHKMMGVLLQCSAILVREKGILQGCNQMCAGYLFQQDKQYDVSYDTGDKAIQCGRHVDIFKFWLMWKAKGTVGFEQHINKCLDLAEYLYTKIKNREGYEMVFSGEVAPKIKARMMECGTTMVGYQPQGDKVNFFRMVVSNSASTKSDIDFLIDEIERLGQDL
ncbi:DCE1 decarboxylase, partial [Polypterus senegalus]